MDNIKIAAQHREELDQLLDLRRQAEDAAAKRHGIDINQFGALLDDRIYNDADVLAIQAKIDAIYGH